MPYLCLFSSHLLELDTSCIFGELHLELAWSMLMIFTARIMHMCYERMWPTYRYIHALYISAAIFSHYWLVWVSLRLAPISKYAFKSLQVAKCIFIAVWKVFTFWCSNRHTLAFSLKGVCIVNLLRLMMYHKCGIFVKPHILLYCTSQKCSPMQSRSPYSLFNHYKINECTGVQNPHRYTHAWLVHM